MVCKSYLKGIKKLLRSKCPPPHFCLCKTIRPNFIQNTYLEESPCTHVSVTLFYSCRLKGTEAPHRYLPCLGSQTGKLQSGLAPGLLTPSSMPVPALHGCRVRSREAGGSEERES